MEWYGNTIAVTMHDLTRSDDGEAIMSRENYDKLVTRGRLTMLRCGKGLGSYALVDYATMPVRFRTRFEAKYGDPEKIMRQENMELAADAAVLSIKAPRANPASAPSGPPVMNPRMPPIHLPAPIVCRCLFLLYGFLVV